MLRAIFFDFNGVIVDDEKLHCRLFQAVLKEKGFTLSEKDYYEKYLGFDDRGAFSAALKDFGAPFDEAGINEMIARKAVLYVQEMKKQDLFVPGALDFVKQASEKYYLGVVSGALRSEIEAWLERGGVKSLFQVIVAAQDTRNGKPDPEGYLRGLDVLNRDFVPNSEMILPQECWALEDSKWGVEAARGAGMRCAALTTSYSKKELAFADGVFGSFAEISLEALAKGFL